MPSVTHTEIKQLAEQYLRGTISQEDRARFDQWYDSMPDQAEWADADTEESLRSTVLQAIYANREQLPATSVHRVHFLRRFRWAAAAAILLACSTGAWFLLTKKAATTTLTARADVAAPVRNKATLTINGGIPILLENIANGAQAADGVTKTDGNSLVYNGSSETIETHSWSNPKASPALFVELPDHSKVWLNAASTISFPTRFTGKTRTVAISGEVYFDVKHDASQPFTVKAGGQTIEDIGTAFNVNAYPDEKGIRTTLVEGEVRVSENAKVATLKPGQAFLNGNVTEADTDQALAWKNGLFSFGDLVDLQTALRQISRWYDVEVVYAGAAPQREFGGKIQRALPISRVIEILKEQNIPCRLEGRKLVVGQ